MNIVYEMYDFKVKGFSMLLIALVSLAVLLSIFLTARKQKSIFYVYSLANLANTKYLPALIRVHLSLQVPKIQI